MIKAAIFDLDGTLIDSMEYWRDCGEIFVRSQNIEPEKDLSQKLFRFSMKDGVDYLHKNYFQSWNTEDINNGIINVLADSYKTKIQLKKGALQILSYLKEKNIPCAIATATPRNLFEPAFIRLDLENYFNKVFTCPELNTNKAVPFIYKEAAKSLFVNENETVVFEDALIPIRTAKKAGFRTVGVFDKSSQNDTDKIKVFSDIYLESLEYFDEKEL
ncbi:MAG: HAD family phosphatase [Clostridiaceae bacterium]|jgi:HAD superfamily hydrolase (TIGR01509 family)|nr:HAD family phosphatase [Clostridiaceae bacterium]